MIHPTSSVYSSSCMTLLCASIDSLNKHFHFLLVLIDMQLIGGAVIIVMLPLVAHSTQSASYVFSQLETSPDSTGIHSKAYAIILSLIVSQYSLYGYDTAAHLTEETKGAEINGPIAILSTLGIISVFGWAYILALTFSIQVNALIAH